MTATAGWIQILLVGWFSNFLSFIGHLLFSVVYGRSAVVLLLSGNTARQPIGHPNDALLQFVVWQNPKRPKPDITIPGCYGHSTKGGMSRSVFA
jgi:hypothetical protein